MPWSACGPTPLVRQGPAAQAKGSITADTATRTAQMTPYTTLTRFHGFHLTFGRALPLQALFPRFIEYRLSPVHEPGQFLTRVSTRLTRVSSSAL